VKVSRGTHSEVNGFLYRLCPTPMPCCLDIDPFKNACPKLALVTVTNPLQHSSLHHPPTTELAFKRTRARVIRGFLDRIDFLKQLHPRGRK
jgi:hypothetical protein